MSGRSGGRDKKGAKEKPAPIQNLKTTDTLDASATKGPQATPEQLRLYQLIDDPKRNDLPPNIEDLVGWVQELTGRSQEEIVVALHDSNYDMNKAANSLLEGQDQGEWKTTTKKTRKPQPPQAQPATSQPAEADTSEKKPPDADSGGVDKENKPENYSNRPMRERPSNNFRGPPRLRRGGGPSGGDKRWKSRERQENERNLAESGGGETGRGRGRGRRDRGQRGRAPRMFQNRQRFDNTEFPKSIDTWSNNQMSNVDNFTATPWEGSVMTTSAATEEVWEAEEWDSTTIESKVFTSSTAQTGDTEHNALASSVLGSSVQDSMSQSIDLSTLLQKPTSSSHGSNDQYLSKQTAQDVFNSQATECIKAAIGVGQNSQTSSSYVSNSTYPSSSREFSSSAYSSSNAYSYGSSPQYSAMHSDYTATPSTATPQPSYSSSASPQANFSTSTTTQSISYTSTAVSFSSPETPSSYSTPSVTGTSQNATLPARKSKPRMSSSKIPSEAVEMPHDGMGELGMKMEGLAFGTATFNDISVEPSFSSVSCTTVSAPPITTTPAVTYNTSTSTLTQHLNAALNQSAKISGGESSISSSFSNQNSTESKTERSTPSFAGTSTSPKTSAPAAESLAGFSVSQSGSSHFQSSYGSQKSSAYQSVATASTYVQQTQSSSSTSYTGSTSSSFGSAQQPGSYPSTQQQHYTTSSYSTPYSTTYSATYQSSGYQATTQTPIFQSAANQYANVYSGGLASNQYSGSAYAPNQSTASMHPSKLGVKDPQFDSTVSTTSQAAGGMSASSAFAFPTSGSTQTTKSLTPTSKTGSMQNVPAGIPTQVMGGGPFVIPSNSFHLAYPQVQQQIVPLDDLMLQASRIPLPTNSRDSSMAYSVNDGVGGVKFSGRNVAAAPDTSTSSPGQTSTAQTQHQFISHTPYYIYHTPVMAGQYTHYNTTPAVYPVNNVVTPATNTGVSNTQFQKAATATAPFLQYNSYGEGQDYSKTKSNMSHGQQQTNDISSVYRTKVPGLDKNAAYAAGIGTPPPGAAYGNAGPQYPLFISAIPNQPLMHLSADSSTGNAQRATGTGQSSKPNAKQGYPGFSNWS